MLLIVGLGNKGLAYRNTFHNMGFMVVDKLVKKLGLRFKYSKCFAKVATVKDKDILIVKPQTYMNLSGKCVDCLLKEYNIKPQDMIVIYDDVDLPKGELRIRERGSAGTHNGMRNIVSTINDIDFVRVRIGIGRPDSDIDLAEYVLSHLNTNDTDIILPTIDKATQCLLEYIENGDIQAMIRASK